MVTRDIHICLIFTFKNTFSFMARRWKRGGTEKSLFLYTENIPMIGLQVSPKVTCTEAAKAPFQRSHSFRTCATLDLQIGSPRLQGNPRKWELLATAPDKGGSGKAETTAGVPEVTARAEVPTTFRTHTLHRTTYCSLRCQGPWFSGLAEPQNSRNS